jgi:RNA polymerase sigma factor FliA
MKSSTALSQSEREESILNQLPQVKLLAKRLHRRCPPTVLLEDLESAGIAGLVKAADRYDCMRGLKFKTLAEHLIRGAMLDYLRGLDPLPRSVRRFVRERNAAIELLQVQANDVPTNEQVAAAMGIALERYTDLVRAAELAESVPVELEEATLASDTATPFDCMLLREVGDAIDALPKRERFIMVALREGFSLSEIARNMEITAGHAAYLKSQAVIRIRTALGIAQPPA